MRDLEKQIADWRRTVAKASSSEAVEELEAHLREEIDRLLRAGTPHDKVFAMAVSKMGSPSALAAEFEKLTLSRRAKWKPATIAQWLCVAVAALFAVWVVARIGTGRMGLLLASHVLAVTIGYTTIFIVGGLGICHVMVAWFGQTGPTQREVFQRATLRLATVALVLTAVGVVLGMLWAKENWGRYWAWDAKETGAVLVLASASLTLGVRWIKPTRHNAIAFAAILGNIGTAWAWFGANTGFQAGPLLIAFTASQCILLGAIPLLRLRDILLAKRP